MDTQEELQKLTIEELQARELNSCDKCGWIGSTYELIWVTPDEDNEHPESIHKTDYDALCPDCYAEIVGEDNVIEIKQGQARLDELYAMLPEDSIRDIVSEIVEIELLLEKENNM